MTRTMKALMPILVLLFFVNLTAGESVGSIATIDTFDGHHFGPYIVKDFHSDEDSMAEPLVGEEGSGYAPSYLETDTENGDDDPSGELPTTRNEHNIESVHSALISALNENINDAAPNVTDQPTTTTTPATTPTPTTTMKPTTTTKRVTTIKETPKPSTTTTKAPTTARVTSKAPPALTPTQSAVTAENSSCHTSCQQLLYRTSLTAKPDTSFIQETETMGFTCEVSIGTQNAAFLQNLSLHWVFEGGDPPQSECALDDQKFLAQCEGFTTRELTELNASSRSSHLIVSGLATRNTGYYKCRVRVDCCSNTLQHELNHSVTVWTADYTLEIVALSGIAVAVLLIFIAGVVFKQRRERRSKAYKSVPNTQTLADGKKTESHIAFVAYEKDSDRDSFSSDGSFSQ